MNAPPYVKRAARLAPEAAQDTAVVPSQYSPVAANSQYAPTPKALQRFIGDGLRALRHAATLTCDDTAPARTAQVLYKARDAVNSAIWAAEYAATLLETGDA